MKIRNNNLLDKGVNVVSVLTLGLIVFLSYTMSQLSVFVVGVIIVIFVRKIIFYIVYGSFTEQADLIDYIDTSSTDKHNIRNVMKQIREEAMEKDKELIRKLNEEAEKIRN